MTIHDTREEIPFASQKRPTMNLTIPWVTNMGGYKKGYLEIMDKYTYLVKVWKE